MATMKKAHCLLCIFGRATDLKSIHLGIYIYIIIIIIVYIYISIYKNVTFNIPKEFHDGLLYFFCDATNSRRSVRPSPRLLHKRAVSLNKLAAAATAIMSSLPWRPYKEDLG